jgi:hypothetical protein
VSERDDDGASDAVEEETAPLQRALDLFVFAPVGIALTVVEDLPGLIGKGQQRFETDVQNARIVGRIVVAQGRRQLLERVGKLLHLTSSDGAEDESQSTAPSDGNGTERAVGAPGAAAAPSTRPAPTPKPTADPADGVIVEAALAGYDTLSASQVVRRLESLGPDELRALQRYEASHRNRHTILNRAHQILEADEAADEAVSPRTTVSAPETDAPEADAPAVDAPAAKTAPSGAAGSESVTPESDLPEAVTPATVPTPTPPPTAASAATAPEPDRPGE